VIVWTSVLPSIRISHKGGEPANHFRSVPDMVGNVIRKTRIFSILLAVLLAVGFSLVSALPLVADGASFYVSTNGDNSHDGLSWQTAWRDIQHAIDRADAGDTINVAAGIYNENITLKDGVAVLGAGADVTTIDGGDNGTVVTADGVGSTTRLEGFTVTQGNAPGGGMYNNNSSPTVANCIFSANSAAYGGGMYNYADSSPTVTVCVFVTNSATYGGGIYNYHSSPTVTGCTFSGNSASKRGGGMYNYDSSAPTVANCIFSANAADDRGGGMYNNNSAPTVTSCTFWANSATCGDGICNDHSSPTVTNCILWDSGQEIHNVLSTPVVSYCDIRLGYSGEGNIDADPLLVEPTAGDCRLSPGSPCLDAGNNALVPAELTTDFEGDPRIADGGDGNAVVDMGADEYYLPLPNNPPNAPTSPLCDGEANFSWSFSDPDGGDSQGAYQILVASTPGKLASNNGDIWDSGRVDGSASQAACGTALDTGRTYYWKLKTWDNNGAEGPYCSQQQFTTRGEAEGTVAGTDLPPSPDESGAGEMVTIGVVVTNTTNLVGSYTVILKMNGVVKATKELTLDAGASESAAFTVPSEEAGNYSILIEGVNGSFTVTAPQGVLPEAESSARWFVIGGVVAGVLIIGLLIFFFVVKKRARWAIYLWFR